MRKIAVILPILVCATSVQAQNFTDHLKQTKKDKVSVTVTQSKEIDSLVNGKGGQKAIPYTPIKKDDKTKTDTAEKKVTGENGKQQNAHKDATLHPDSATSRKLPSNTPETTIKKNETANRNQPEKEEETENTTVNLHRKVMRDSRKINGYRIQVYSGGNSRADKKRAQQIGIAIKKKFPEEPVYVHFYSPSWKCRVGNYRTYAEAHAMLKKIKAMGYRSAIILKGKITVQY